MILTLRQAQGEDILMLSLSKHEGYEKAAITSCVPFQIIDSAT